LYKTKYEDYGGDVIKKASPMTTKAIFRWKPIIIATTAGMLIIMTVTGIYGRWVSKDNMCMRFFPDGQKQTLYGKDCLRP